LLDRAIIRCFPSFFGGLAGDTKSGSLGSSLAQLDRIKNLKKTKVEAVVTIAIASQTAPSIADEL
jgi:hypothetical protein